MQHGGRAGGAVLGREKGLCKGPGALAYLVMFLE